MPLRNYFTSVSHPYISRAVIRFDLHTLYKTVTIYVGELYQLQAVSSVKSRAQQTNIAVSGSVGYKQVLDEVVVISRIIKVKVAVISGIPRLIALTETLIILDITKTKFNN